MRDNTMTAMVMFAAACWGTSAIVGSVLVDRSGGGDYLTIQAALEWAPDGVTIYLTPDTYEECLVADGRTGEIDDLLQMLGAWGTCPKTVASAYSACRRTPRMPCTSAC